MFNPNFLDRRQKNTFFDQLTEKSSLNKFLLIFGKNDTENAFDMLIFFMHHSFRLLFSFFFLTVIDMYAKMVNCMPLKLYGEGGCFLYIISHTHVYIKISL